MNIISTAISLNVAHPRASADFFQQHLGLHH